MKNALIDPTTSVQHIAAWVKPSIDQPFQPVFEVYPNSARVAEVADAPFDVATPLFWVACADDVVADQWYYDTANAIIYPVVNAPYPVMSDQPPIVTGAQTL
jgi:hypothetical protein